MDDMEEVEKPFILEQRAEESVAVLFLRWLFVESTIKIFKTWVFFLRFGIEIFSIPLLVRTFWYPWRRYFTGYPKGFNPALMFESFFGNIMSRVIGMILRIFFIFLGIIFDILIFAVGSIVLVLWVTGPFLSIYMLFAGIRIFLLGHL